MNKFAAAAGRSILRRSFVVLFFLITLGGVAAEAVTSLSMTEDMPAGRFLFRIYGVENGLSNLSIWALAQDRTGFIWAGTEDGLFRYDGNRFQRFGIEEGLPSAQVTLLLAGKDGEIWAGTLRGAAYFDGQKFIPAPSTLPSGEVKSLGQDSQGRLWVALNSGLYRGNAEKGFELAPGWPGGAASAVFIDSKRSGQAYVALGSRLGRLDPDGSWTILKIDRMADSDIISAVAVDAEGRLWVRSPDHLFVKDIGASEFRDESKRIPSGGMSNSLCLDRNWNIWIPVNTGLLLHRNGLWSAIQREQGLPADWTRTIMEDREGSIWIASLGVFRLIGGGNWLAWTTQEGLPSNTIWGIYRARNGMLHVGTDRGLAIASSQGWRVKKESTERTIRSVTETPDGWMWMGGNPGEIVRWNPGNGRTERFGLMEGLPGDRIISLFTDRKGDLWVTLEGSGLRRWTARGDGGLFERIELPGGTQHERCFGLLEDRRGRLWVMGENGLAMKDEKGWHRFTTRDGLARDFVSWGVEADNGDLWISYYEPLGIVCFRVEGDRLQIIRRLDKESGLSSGKVYFLGRDSQTRIWIGLGNGIDLLGPTGISHIDTGDGLAGQDCDSNAFLAEAGGTVFVGTSAGLSLFRGGRDPVRNEPPPAHLLSARLGDRNIPTDGTPISVKSSENTLEVKFTGLSFLNEARVRYEVRMIGLENDWRATDVREARYPSLRPKTYRFEVRARQGNGPYGDPAGISFIIRPPWWQTWPARIGFILLAVALVGGGFRYRMRSLKQRARELESIVFKRTRDLAEANESLARLSVTDPLTRLKNRRYLYLSMPEDVAQCKRIHHDIKLGKLTPGTARGDIIFLMIDLDRFKSINDTYGHAAGDRVLFQIRDILNRTTRGTDTVVRWGGEEFLVVARSTFRQDAARLAERLLCAIQEHRFEVGDGQTKFLTCSIGFSTFPVLRGDPDRVSWEGAVEIADEALFAAKRNGRNAWVGLTAVGTTLPDDFLTRLRKEATIFLAGGTFSVQTSLGDPERLHWT